jgi:hypothetical protein
MSFLDFKILLPLCVSGGLVCTGCQERVDVYSGAIVEYQEGEGSRPSPRPTSASTSGGLPRSSSTGTGTSAGSSTGTAPQPSISAGNGSANFNQYAGYFDHPKKQGRAQIGGGKLAVVIDDTSVKVSLSSLVATKAERDDVRKAVLDINGQTFFNRVRSSGLPAGDKFQKAAAFLIFSTSVKSKKGVTFSAGPGQFFPAFALAGSSESDFAALNEAKGQLAYPVTFTSSAGGSFSTNVLVDRVMNGQTGCGDLPGFTALLTKRSEYYGIRISLAPNPPNDFINDFPFGTTVYAIRFANGGMVTHVGTCSFYHDREHGQGKIHIEFNR